LPSYVNDSKVAARVLTLLVAQSEELRIVSQLARLLPEVQVDYEYLAGVALSIMPRLAQPAQEMMLAGLFRRMGDEIARAEFLPLPVIELLRQPAAVLAVRRVGYLRILDWMLPCRVNGSASLSSKLLSLATIPAIEDMLVDGVEEISRRLAAGGRPRAGEEYAFWARAIEMAQRSNRQSVVAAAAIAVKHVFEQRSTGVEGLLRVAFPIVYHAVVNSHYNYELSRLFSFFDWDRAKTLREELVEAFVKSNWRPGDLVVTAEICGIAAKILKRLARRSEGARIFKGMKADLGSRHEAEASRALGRISEFENSPPPIYDWD